LACQSNMAVLNTTVMRRAKESILMNKANAKAEGASKKQGSNEQKTSSSSKGGGGDGGSGGGAGGGRGGGGAVVVSTKGGNGHAVIMEAKEQFKGKILEALQEAALFQTPTLSTTNNRHHDKNRQLFDTHEGSKARRFKLVSSSH